MRLKRFIVLGSLYLSAAAAFTCAARVSEQQARRQGGMQFTCVDRAPGAGGARLAEVRQTIDLSFLDEHPECPRRLFSAKWTGFWYLPAALTVDLYAGADDRVVVRLDGETVLVRGPQVGMHTAMRTLQMAEGVHRLEIDYEQDGGGMGLNAGWAPSGLRPRSMETARLFPTAPDRRHQAAIRRASWLRFLAAMFWVVPPLACLLVVAAPTLRGWMRLNVIPPERTAALGLLVLVLAGVALRLLLIRGSPAPFGYVYDPYYEPVEIFYRTGRLPVAADCWQCYHPPLFYIVGLPFFAAGMWLFGHDATRALTVLGLLATVCGGLCVYYTYRLLRLFRLRRGELVVASAITLSIPVLFFSSYGSEADILLSAVVIAFLFHLTRYHAHARRATWRQAALIGTLAGLAIATKYSGLVTVVVTGGVFAIHAVRRDRWRAVRHGLIALTVCMAIGSWKYVDNAATRGTPLFANGSAQEGLRATMPPRFWHDYDFRSFRLADLLVLARNDAPAGSLIYQPVYKSVWTTLHGMAWGDMGFFSNPSRGGINKVYVWRGVPAWLASSVVVLGLLPSLLAIVGVLGTATRRSLVPVLLTCVITLPAYVYWFTAQRDWSLKTKYILFLLPAYVLYAMFGLRWLGRMPVPGLRAAAFWLLVLLAVASHGYLFMFAVGTP